ncbi:MAG TPA: DinB family protein [Terriglobales bacterium]|nr:DinB family protein [Terriglobales bacterium]
MSAVAQPETEREQLSAALRKSREVYLRCVKEVSENGAAARLSENSWSILEIAEHVAVAEHGMFRAVELGTDKTSEPDYGADAGIIRRGLNREVRSQAPERSRPKGRWKTLAEAINAFEKSREKTLDFVENGGKDPRRIESVHPLFGSIDGHQILLIMAVHAERHTAQIEDIKRTQAYRNAAGK